MQIFEEKFRKTYRNFLSVFYVFTELKICFFVKAGECLLLLLEINLLFL